ncbi:hypothetical protein C8R44DRAFT_740065 [Mycena epipterygia]|nr:hypothetical protein C8R44DRAFT_745876 [Mycena epipterygia]KAJ7114687.1 hypothetical protein C8R44DRAFT_740065 [Mycena epipterygia]
MVGSRKDRKGSEEFEPNVSKAEKARRARKATASHYRRNPDARKKKKLAVKTAREGKRRARPGTEPEPEPVKNSMCKDKDEEVASQVLTSMYLARQREAQTLSTTPQRQRRPSPTGTPLPPSSPPPLSSPEATAAPPRPVKVRGWVSPGEWEAPGSPLPDKRDESKEQKQTAKDLGVFGAFNFDGRVPGCEADESAGYFVNAGG